MGAAATWKFLLVDNMVLTSGGAPITTAAAATAATRTALTEAAVCAAHVALASIDTLVGALTLINTGTMTLFDTGCAEGAR